MGQREEQRVQAAERIARHLLATGLSQASLRQLAAAAGVSDRMLLYYFDSKAAVLTAALGQIAGEVTRTIALLVPPGRSLSLADLLGRTARLTRGPRMRPFMRLWIEVVAAAARKEEPYVEIAKIIATGFLHWIEDRLGDVDEHKKPAMAAMVLAMIDGLALLDACVDEAHADTAVLEMEKLIHPEMG